ncbi:MAG TPA: hypothetical protein VEL47_04445, partial [Myxococcota bacterium]|nr:hypothetical protein [Myxococcota bacterium]
MKKIIHFICGLALFFGLASHADIVGEEASYVLTANTGRNSWVIKSGNGKATVASYQTDAPLGPSYLVNLDYTMNIRLHGPETGTISILIPESMFGEQFFQNLVTTHPVDLGDFKVDFLGMVTAVDNEGNQYEQSYSTRIYDINTGGGLFDDYEPQIVVVAHKGTGILVDIENLEIKI